MQICQSIIQHAKKILADSLWLVDHLLSGQVKFPGICFEEIQIQFSKHCRGARGRGETSENAF